jgi:two-component system, chemotaxis family, protein-glutamate methylesterase/glutaminase
VITVFLRSLAQYWDGKIVAVIVSGRDADGTEALRDIKEVGGITIAQTPETAEWSDMPDSAIKTGYIDFVLSAEDIAGKIAEIAKKAT